MEKINWKQTKKQNEAWTILNDKKTNELLFGGGAGGGKSLLGCGWIITNCGRYPGTRWLIGRSKLKTLKETTLKTFFEVCSRWEIKEGEDYKYNSIDGTIIWTNGSEILLKDLFAYPADPNFDSLGSLELTGAFIDEVNQLSFKAWDVVNSRIRFKLDEYDLIPKILGTCNPSKQWVYSEFYDPWKKRKLLDYRKFVQALAKDNPFISKHYISNLKKIKNRAIRERLLDGNWEYDDDPSCLFEFQALNDLFTNKAKDSIEKYIVVDAARKGRDAEPVTYWEGLQCKEIITLPYEIKSNLKRAAEWIMAYAQRKGVRFSHILVDEDGVGGGIVDIIPNCTGFINGSSPIQPREAAMDPNRKVNYLNLRAQCYDTLSVKTNQGEIGIDEPSDTDTKEKLIEELAQIKQKDIDKDGKIAIISKDVIKSNLGRSPDFADNVMMRMYFELEVKNEPRIRTL